MTTATIAVSAAVPATIPTTSSILKLIGSGSELGAGSGFELGAGSGSERGAGSGSELGADKTKKIYLKITY